MLYSIKRLTQSGRLVRLGNCESLDEAKRAVSFLPVDILDDIGIYHNVTGRCVVDGSTVRDELAHAR